MDMTSVYTYNSLGYIVFIYIYIKRSTRLESMVFHNNICCYCCLLLRALDSRLILMTRVGETPSGTLFGVGATSTGMEGDGLLVSCEILEGVGEGEGEEDGDEDGVLFKTTLYKGVGQEAAAELVPIGVVPHFAGCVPGGLRKLLNMEE
jgi:hypothetical protein